MEVNAETAGSALFLGQLFSATNDKRYLDAAVKAMAFIEAEIVPTRQWFDFETFFSCSQKPEGFYDHFTQQYPENNLGKLQAAAAFLQLFQITKDPQFLNLGTRVLDYTLLTQQVWTHPLLSPNLLGGFTTQNTDCEWSDARQGQAAAIILDYYRETHLLEYLERGVAALRSSFAIAPYENWAHTGGSEGDFPGALTGIHWCQGSAMTSIEISHPWLKDAYINVKYSHGVGVNGCSVKSVSLSAQQVSFQIESRYQWPRPLEVVIDDAGEPLQVVANGVHYGMFTPQQLSNGIAVKL